ncbi:MAG: PilZ domain-containing protein [Myxococcota bacterium]
MSRESFLVQYRVDGETQFDADYARGLSAEGLWLETDLDPGTVLQVRLPLSSGTQLMERLGRIDDDSEPYRFVRFLDGNQDDRQSISVSVESRDTMELPTEDVLYPLGFNDEDETLPG